MRSYKGARPDVFLDSLFDKGGPEWREWRKWTDIVHDLADNKRTRAKGMPWEWRRVLERLKRRKLVEEQKRGDRLMIRLTEKGRWQQELKSIKKKPDHYPVGQGCVVVFDIPESERVARNMFRRFLKECGFRQLQRSVWVCRKDVVDFVADFVSRNKLTQWIQVIEGKVRT